MFQSIHLYSDGTNIFTLLGTLTAMKDKLKEIIVWNVSGLASLIIFFKILGFNYNQTFEIIKEFELIDNMINGCSLMLEDEEDKLKVVKNWLIDYIDQNGILNIDSTISEIYHTFKFFPNFILYNRNRKTIHTINPDNNPNFTLLDCVLASLCGLGIYKKYNIDDNIFSNLYTILPIPIEYNFNNIEGSNNLTILLETEYNFLEGKKETSPLWEIENEFLQQKSELHRYNLHKIEKNLENYIKIFSYYSRGKVIMDEKLTLFNIGFNQGIKYIEGGDTEDAYKEQLKYIRSQS